MILINLVDFLCASWIHTGSVSWLHEVDPDPVKWYGSDRIRIRIHNTGQNGGGGGKHTETQADFLNRVYRRRRKITAAFAADICSGQHPTTEAEFLKRIYRGRSLQRPKKRQRITAASIQKHRRTPYKAYIEDEDYSGQSGGGESQQPAYRNTGGLPKKNI